MRFVTAPNSVHPGSCGLLTYHIGAWVEPACPDSRDPDKSGLETAPTKQENSVGSVESAQLETAPTKQENSIGSVESAQLETAPTK